MTRFDLRTIAFPNTPGISTETFTTLNYLKYLLPYASTLQIKDQRTDELLVKTVLPDDLYLRSYLEDSDPSSSSYNKPRIDGYINKGMFTQIPITTIERVTLPPTSDITNYTITTSKAILHQSNFWNYENLQGIFKRGDNLWYTLGFYGEGGNDFVVAHGTINGIFYSDDIIADNSMINASSPVVDSSGVAWILVQVYHIGLGEMVLAKRVVDATRTSGYAFDATLPVNNLGVGNGKLIAQPIDGVSTISYNSSNIQYKMIIDETDTKYIVDDIGIYKINEVTNIFEEVYKAIGFGNESVLDAVYNIHTQTFIISTQEQIIPPVDPWYYLYLIQEVDKTGTILSSVPSVGSYDDNISLASSTVLGNWLVGGATEKVILSSDLTAAPTNVELFLSNPSNINNYANPYYDGDSNNGEISAMKQFVNLYDITEPNIYFADSLRDSRYFEQDMRVWMSQDIQNDPAPPLNYIEFYVWSYDSQISNTYNLTDAEISFEIEMNGVWVAVPDLLGVDIGGAPVYPYVKTPKASLLQYSRFAIVVWNGSVPDNTATGIISATGLRVTITKPDKITIYLGRPDPATAGNWYVDFLNTTVQDLPPQA